MMATGWRLWAARWCVDVAGVTGERDRREGWLGDGSGDREVRRKMWMIKSLTRDVDY